MQDNYINDSQMTQWWLATLDKFDNVEELIDGAHSNRSGADKALYLRERLGFKDTNRKYAVVKCEVFKPTPNLTDVNEEAIDILNSIKK